MFQGEHATYYGANYIGIGDQGWPPGDATEAASGLSEAQMKAMYETLQADPLVDHVSLNDVASSMTTPLTDPFMAGGYDGWTERAGFMYPMQYGKSRDEILEEAPVQLNHWARGDDEAISAVTDMNMLQCQQSEITPSNMQLRDLAFSGNNNSGTDVHPEFHKKTAKPNSTAKSSKSHLTRKARQRSKEQANRKFIFDEKLRAVQELLPRTLKVNQDSVQSNQESVLDNCIGYIKYLELQLKDMTATALGGESGSAPLFYLEGHGHYYPNDDKGLFGEPLEEVFGQLLKENPTAAFAFLECHGLHMLPMDSIQDLTNMD